MYRSEEHQISFFDFNQSSGMQLNKDNEWIKRKIDRGRGIIISR